LFLVVAWALCPQPLRRLARIARLFDERNGKMRVGRKLFASDAAAMTRPAPMIGTIQGAATAAAVSPPGAVDSTRFRPLALAR